MHNSLKLLRQIQKVIRELEERQRHGVIGSAAMARAESLRTLAYYLERCVLKSGQTR